MARPRRDDPVGLGVWPDEAVAAEAGITRRAVTALRQVRGIPAPSKRVSFPETDRKKVADGK